MSMTRAADARSQAVSPVLILSMTGKPERSGRSGQSRARVATVAVRWWRWPRNRWASAARSVPRRSSYGSDELPGSRKGTVRSPCASTDDVLDVERFVDRAAYETRQISDMPVAVTLVERARAAIRLRHEQREVRRPLARREALGSGEEL